MKKEDIIFTEKPIRKEFVDVENRKFGRLIVLGYAGKVKTRHLWWCECNCPDKNIIKTDSYKLRTEHTQSCGCLQRERTGDSRRIHGMTNSPENNSYRAARERCTYKKHPHYQNYGGRGIKFLFRNFVEFYECLGEMPEPKRAWTIERIDVNGHYECGNVKWATYKEQGNNKRNNIGRSS